MGSQWLLLLVWAAVVALVAALASFVLSKASHLLTPLLRGIYGGILGSFCPLAFIWLVDAASSGEPDFQGWRIAIFGGILFGLLPGLPVAFLTAKILDRARPKAVDPKIFE